jgi:acyl dehydratase
MTALDPAVADPSAIDAAAVAVGTELPPLALPPISRTTLALFAGASGDHNPIHIDLDVARSAGMDDVFAHGMLSMAYLGRLLTGWVPQERIRSYGVRFAAITRCTGSRPVPVASPRSRTPTASGAPGSIWPSLWPTAP